MPLTGPLVAVQQRLVRLSSETKERDFVARPNSKIGEMIGTARAHHLQENETGRR